MESVNSFDSSVGRAEDCRRSDEILGRWFESGSKEMIVEFFLSLIALYVCIHN